MSLVFLFCTFCLKPYFFFSLSTLFFFAVAQKAAIVHMITAHMDTMNAAALLTDSVIIMLTITETVQCLLLLAQEVVLLGEALRHRTHILTLEFETPSPSLTPHGVTCTEMTEEDVLIGRTITVGAGHLIPRSLDTHPRSGPQDRTLNLLIPPREPHYLLEEAHDLNPAVDLRVLIRSAAPAAQAAAGVIFFQVLVFMFIFQEQQTFDLHCFCITKCCTLNFAFLYFFFNLLFMTYFFQIYFYLTTVIPTAPQVMALGHALFSLQPHMRRLSHLW